MLALLLIVAGVAEPSTVFGWIISAIGVMGFLAAGTQFIRGSYDKTTILSLQNSVNALETAGDLKDGKIEGLVKQVKALTNELEVWRNAVTAKEEVTHLTQAVLEHHVEAMKRTTEIKDCLNEIDKKVASNITMTRANAALIKRASKS